MESHCESNGMRFRIVVVKNEILNDLWQFPLNVSSQIFNDLFRDILCDTRTITIFFTLSLLTLLSDSGLEFIQTSIILQMGRNSKPAVFGRVTSNQLCAIGPQSHTYRDIRRTFSMFVYNTSGLMVK